MTDANPSATPVVDPTPNPAPSAGPPTPAATPDPAPVVTPAPTVTPASSPLPALYLQVLARFKGPLTLVNALNLVTVSIEVAESTNLPGATKKSLVIDTVNAFVDRSPLPDAEKALLKASLTVLLPGMIDAALVDVANKALASSCC